MIKYLAAIVTLFALQANAQVARLSRLSRVNSPTDEQHPVMSPDGRQLYFTLANNVQNSGGIGDHGDIWVSVLSDSGWNAPVRSPDVINNELHNVVAGFSADGNRMYLIGHYQSGGKPVTSQGLSVCEKTATGWSAPRNIVIPYFKNKSPYQSGYVSPDETVFVFSGESYSTQGADDIYVSLKEAGKWSEPVNLGPLINTPNQDVSPSLSKDGKRLYFSSNGHDGFGSFDIFYSDRLDDSWQNWSPPQNMGEGYNTEGRELFYREFMNAAFFTSTLNSEGFGNIRLVPVAGEPAVTQMGLPPAVVAVPEPTEIKQVENKEVAATKITGRVINSKTNTPIGGAIIVFHSADQRVEVMAGDGGSYAASLPLVADYNVRVEAVGYIGKFEKLDSSAHLTNALEMNFSLQPVEVGTTINLKNVLFVRSQPVLLEGSFDELDMVVDFMKRNPTVEIELSGHTDNRGRHEQNMKLSRERVDAVKAYLVNKGIDPKKISGKGYGGIKPIADNESEESRAMNRRVEFTIIKE